MPINRYHAKRPNGFVHLYEDNPYPIRVCGWDIEKQEIVRTSEPLTCTRCRRIEEQWTITKTL